MHLKHIKNRRRLLTDGTDIGSKDDHGLELTHPA